MQERTYTKEEIEAARTSAAHSGRVYRGVARVGRPQSRTLGRAGKRRLRSRFAAFTARRTNLARAYTRTLKPRSRRFTGMRQKAGVPERGKLQDLHCVRRF